MAEQALTEKAKAVTAALETVNKVNLAMQTMQQAKAKLKVFQIRLARARTAYQVAPTALYRNTVMALKRRVQQQTAVVATAKSVVQSLPSLADAGAALELARSELAAASLLRDAALQHLDELQASRDLAVATLQLAEQQVVNAQSRIDELERALVDLLAAAVAERAGEYAADVLAPLESETEFTWTSSKLALLDETLADSEDDLSHEFSLDV